MGDPFNGRVAPLQQPPEIVLSGTPPAAQPSSGFLTTVKRLAYRYLPRSYRTVVRLNFIVASLVLTLNFSALVWGWVSFGSDGFDSSGAGFYAGDCNDAAYLNTGVHLIINVAAALLLGGSNFCMQCLVAPTRREVDAAHRKRRWLDIGTPSYKNLLRTTPLKKILWIVLGLSSLPLHLFWNSAVFSSTSANAYVIYTANEKFVDASVPDPGGLDPRFSNLRKAIHGEPFVQLDAEKCVQDYASLFQSSYGNLVLVVGDDHNAALRKLMMPNGAVANPANWSSVDGLNVLEQHQVDVVTPDGGCPYDPYSWICYGDAEWCTTGRIPCMNQVPQTKTNATAGSWQPFGIPVKSCFAEKPQQHCRLNISLPIMCIVAGMNLAKVLTMAYIGFWMSSNPLITIGDAISSFIQEPDNETKDLCLISKRDLVEEPKRWSRKPKRYQRRQHRWLDSLSRSRWISCLLVFVVGLIVLVALLRLAFSKKRYSNQSVWTESLGQPDADSILVWMLPKSGLQAFLENTMVANISQPIISAMYFIYNACLTSTLQAHEWATYVAGDEASVTRAKMENLQRKRGVIGSMARGYVNAREYLMNTEKQLRPKSLRVSSAPQGLQFTSFFIHVPHKYSLPLLASASLAQWMASQALFVVSVMPYSSTAESYRTLEPAPYVNSFLDNNDGAQAHELITCGFSIPAIVALVVVAFSMILAGIPLSLVRLRPGMPLVGSCSAAIAAACHVDADTLSENKDKSQVLSTTTSTMSAATAPSSSPSSPREDEDQLLYVKLSLAQRKLHWGVVEREGYLASTGERVGHCTFSDGPVRLPVEGQLYAGLTKSYTI